MMLDDQSLMTGATSTLAVANRLKVPSPTVKVKPSFPVKDRFGTYVKAPSPPTVSVAPDGSVMVVPTAAGLPFTEVISKVFPLVPKALTTRLLESYSQASV